MPGELLNVLQRPTDRRDLSGSVGPVLRSIGRIPNCGSCAFSTCSVDPKLTDAFSISVDETVSYEIARADASRQTSSRGVSQVASSPHSCASNTFN
jgi:hypothetical protein